MSTTTAQPNTSPSFDVRCSKVAKQTGERIQMRLLGDQFNGRETSVELIAEYVQDAIDAIVGEMVAPKFAQVTRACEMVREDFGQLKPDDQDLMRQLALLWLGAWQLTIATGEPGPKTTVSERRPEPCVCGSIDWNSGGRLGAHCCRCNRDLVLK